MRGERYHLILLQKCPQMSFQQSSNSIFLMVTSVAMITGLGGDGCRTEAMDVLWNQFGRPPFISMTAAQWRMKSKMTDFPGLKIPSALLSRCAARGTCSLVTLLLRLCEI